MTDPRAPFTVWAIPKNRADDMTDGRGVPAFGPITDWLDADDWAERNASPDNPNRYEVRDVDDRRVIA